MRIEVSVEQNDNFEHYRYYDSVAEAVEDLQSLKIEEFIDDFKAMHPQEITDLFANGYCYWFAFILKERFKGTIFYEPIVNHFYCQIDGNFYDINGRMYFAKNANHVYPWEEYKHIDYLETKRIIRDCINKERMNEI